MQIIISQGTSRERIKYDVLNIHAMGLAADDVGMIKFKGTFDLTGLLRMVYAFLKNKGYDFYEDTHKAKPPELELKWLGERKVTPYYMYKVKISFHFYGLKEVDVEDANGNKKKMNEARFTVSFDGDVVKDYAKEWGEKEKENMKLLKGFYEALTKREFMAKHAEPLIIELSELRDKINSYIGMTASY